jgi:HEPN domain-containing protein
MALDPQQATRAWLDQADEDLAAARNALRASLALPGAAAYHAQQAVEKALKGYLTSREEVLLAARDLPQLLLLCRQMDEEFSLLEPAIATLQPYFARYLRTGPPVEPRYAQAETAVELATGVVEFVRARV